MACAADVPSLRGPCLEQLVAPAPAGAWRCAADVASLRSVGRQELVAICDWLGDVLAARVGAIAGSPCGKERVNPLMHETSD